MLSKIERPLSMQMVFSPRWIYLMVALATLVLGDGAAAQEDYAVMALDFDGVERLSQKTLREALATKSRPWSHRFLFWKESPRFGEDEFALDLLRIVKFYQLEGFLEARVDSHRVIVDDGARKIWLKIFVNEGRPLLVQEVLLRDLDGAIPNERSWRLLPERLNLQRGRRWRDADMKADVNRIASTLAIASFPYAQVASAVSIDSASYRAVVDYAVRPGPFCTFGKIQVAGLEDVPERVILRELNLPVGKRFNQSLLSEGQRQIYRLELFQFVSVRATNLQDRATEIPVEVKVKEAPRHTVKTGVGYGTEDGYRASVNWRRRNFLGGGRRLEAQLKSSKLEPVKVEMNLIQPHFFDRRNVAVFNPFFVRQDEANFNINRLGVNVSVQRHFSTYTDGFLNYRFEIDRIDSDRTLAAVDSSAAEELKRNKSVGTFGLIRNNSRPLFNPARGGVNSLTLEYAGRAFNSKFPYWKVIVERRGYVALGAEWIFAYRAKAGAMAPVGQGGVTPIEERFYAGGSVSVRGWQRSQLGPLSRPEQTPLGGNTLFEGSTELRFPLYRLFRGAAFIDFGNVWEPPLDEALRRRDRLPGLRTAAGLGLRFETPIGPIRLDVAGKINKQYPGEYPWEFHLSVGQAF
jgi:outer membrane protein insertion porin family